MSIENIVDVLIKKGYKQPTTVLELIENSDLLLLTIEELINPNPTQVTKDK